MTEAAVFAIGKFGGTTDIELLIDAVENLPSVNRQKALDAVRGLMRASADTIEATLQSDSTFGLEAALLILSDATVRQELERLKALLQSDDEKVRTIAADRMMSTLDRAELTTVLNGYLDNASYYYDVVHRLDWHILGIANYQGGQEAGS